MNADRDSIRMVEYDPAWPDLFRAEAARLITGLEGTALDVQHIGSTAVPGLAAKPVVDIMIGVADMDDLAGLVERLGCLDYTHVPIDEGKERYLFFTGMPRRYHVHVVSQGSWTFWKHILFRDYLMDHPSAQEDYEALRFVLASKFVHDRSAYVQGKTGFIEMVVQQAVTERCLWRTPP
jgi:GrpB-like predicted nucleotidyltransferase (UPF0157 family)